MSASPQKSLNRPPDTGVLLEQHLQVARVSLRGLLRAPLASLLTVAVIAIALALPAGLNSLLRDARVLAERWRADNGIALFLRHGIPAQAVEVMAASLRGRPEFAGVRVVPPEQALAGFEGVEALSEALRLLDSNPLPYLLLLDPRPEAVSPAALSALLHELRRLPDVEVVQFDLHWLERLGAITDTVGRSAWILAFLLGLAVLVLVGNTIRLEIQNRRAEIQVMLLMGATEDFVRRPFLYGGFWYGLAGGVLAWILLFVSLGLLGGPVERLAALYHSDFVLAGAGLRDLLALALAGPLLGMGGAWLAVARHLALMEWE
jgi:cell division transport system permease protein